MEITQGYPLLAMDAFGSTFAVVGWTAKLDPVLVRLGVPLEGRGRNRAFVPGEGSVLTYTTEAPDWGA